MPQTSAQAWESDAGLLLGHAVRALLQEDRAVESAPVAVLSWENPGTVSARGEQDWVGSCSVKSKGSARIAF